MDVAWSYIHPSHKPPLTAWYQRQEKESQVWWLELSTKWESQASAKFIRGQEEPGGAALRISKGLAMVSIPFPLQPCLSHDAKGLQPGYQLQPAWAQNTPDRSTLLPSASTTAWCSVADVISLSTCHSRGEKAAQNYLNSVQQFMQTVNTRQSGLPRVTLQAPGIKGFISISSPSQFPICQRNKR